LNWSAEGLFTERDEAFTGFPEESTIWRVGKLDIPNGGGARALTTTPRERPAPAITDAVTRAFKKLRLPSSTP